MASGDAVAFLGGLFGGLGRLWKRFYWSLGPAWNAAIGKDPSPDRNRQLLDHFLIQLADEFLYVRHPSPGDQPVDNAAIIARIDALIAEATMQVAAADQSAEATQRGWGRANEIERLLVYLKPSSLLWVDVERRIDEAARVGLPSAAKYRAELDAITVRLNAARAALTNAVLGVAAAQTDAERTRAEAIRAQAQQHLTDDEMNSDLRRRAMLAAVLNDIQWQQQKTILIRSALWESATNLLGFGFFTMFVVAIPFLCFTFEAWTPWKPFSLLLDNFPNYGLYTAMSFGLLGAFFSRLTSLKFTGELTLEEAENRYSFSSLWIRGAVGMCGALLLYFLMRTQIVTGITPDFENFTYEQMEVRTVLKSASVLIPSKDWAMLALWSFIAGFSEKLVPDSLSRVEAQVSGKKP